jgi:hypothetical protein
VDVTALEVVGFGRALVTGGLVVVGDDVVVVPTGIAGTEACVLAVVKGGTSGTAGARVVRVRTWRVVVVRSRCVVLVGARRPLVVIRALPPWAVVAVAPVVTGADGLVPLIGPTTGTAGFDDVGVVAANWVRVRPVPWACLAGGFVGVVVGRAEVAGPDVLECFNRAGSSPAFLVVGVSGVVVVDVCRRDVGTAGRPPGREGTVVGLEVLAGGSWRTDEGALPPALVVPKDGIGTAGSVVMACPVGGGVAEPAGAVVPELSMPTAAMCLGELEPPATL